VSAAAHSMERERAAGVPSTMRLVIMRELEVRAGCRRSRPDGQHDDEERGEGEEMAGQRRRRVAQRAGDDLAQVGEPALSASAKMARRTSARPARRRSSRGSSHPANAEPDRVGQRENTVAQRSRYTTTSDARHRSSGRVTARAGRDTRRRPCWRDAYAPAEKHEGVPRDDDALPKLRSSYTAGQGGAPTPALQRACSQRTTPPAGASPAPAPPARPRRPDSTSAAPGQRDGGSTSAPPRGTQGRVASPMGSRARARPTCDAADERSVDVALEPRTMLAA